MANTRNGKASIHCYIEAELKAEADKLFSDLGLTTSDAISIFFRKCIAEGGFPFEVKLTDEAREYLRRRSMGAKRLKDVPKTFETEEVHEG